MDARPIPGLPAGWFAREDGAIITPPSRNHPRPGLSRSRSIATPAGWTSRNRLVARAWIGEPPDPAARAVRIDLDAPPAPANLRWSTDRRTEAGWNRGGNLLRQVVRPEWLPTIRRAKGRRPAREVAEALGVDAGAVKAIWSGRTWRGK